MSWTKSCIASSFKTCLDQVLCRTCGSHSGSTNSECQNTLLALQLSPQKEPENSPTQPFLSFHGCSVPINSSTTRFLHYQICFFPFFFNIKKVERSHHMISGCGLFRDVVIGSNFGSVRWMFRVCCVQWFDQTERESSSVHFGCTLTKQAHELKTKLDPLQNQRELIVTHLNGRCFLSPNAGLWNILIK